MPIVHVQYVQQNNWVFHQGSLEGLCRHGLTAALSRSHLSIQTSQMSALFRVTFLTKASWGPKTFPLAGQHTVGWPLSPGFLRGHSPRGKDSVLPQLGKQYSKILPLTFSAPSPRHHLRALSSSWYSGLNLTNGACRSLRAGKLLREPHSALPPCQAPWQLP